MSTINPDLRYLQHTPAGAQYVRQITHHESDRKARLAFRDLVLHIAPRGAALLDFGAGPGMDARFFAERGFTIDAYDVDPRMREFFAEHCRDLIESGHVRLDASAYCDFLAQTAENGRHADIVISNFAPLNLIDDLQRLFLTFHARTGPQGKVVASVLNPCPIQEMRSLVWWRRAPRLWRDGELFLAGPQAPHYRRLLGHFRKMSAPHFRLSRVFRGQPPPHGGPPHGIDPHRSFAWFHLAHCRYMFLLFEKQDAGQ
jgi:SAM-dependent methyltransferase